jgi:hypothetical protein
MHKSWGAVIEAGAGWLIKLDHKIFTIGDYVPQKPLDVEPAWHTTIRKGERLIMTNVEIDRFSVKIEDICEKLGYKKRTRAENIGKLKMVVDVEN